MAINVHYVYWFLISNCACTPDAVEALRSNASTKGRERKLVQLSLWLLWSNLGYASFVGVALRASATHVAFVRNVGSHSHGLKRRKAPGPMPSTGALRARGQAPLHPTPVPARPLGAPGRGVAASSSQTTNTLAPAAINTEAGGEQRSRCQAPSRRAARSLPRSRA